MERAKNLLTQYAAGGNDEAFAVVAREHADMVYGTCFRILRDAGAAEDAAQESFLELARKAADVPERVGAWLHGVATRKALHAARTRKRRKYHEAQAAYPREDSKESTWAEIAPVLDEALDEIPEPLREALVAHYLLGKTQTEIAAGLGVTQATISRRIDQAVEELRKRLKKSGVLVPGLALAGMLVSNIAEAAPASVLLGLGKIAASGVGVQATTTAATAAAAGAGAKTAAVGVSSLVIGGAVKKAIAVAIIATTVAAGGVVVHKTIAKKPAPAPAAHIPVVEPDTREKITYEGVVTDLAGNPIPNVAVRSDVSNYHHPARYQLNEADTVTDDNGRFTLGPVPVLDKYEAGRTLICEHPDYALGWFSHSFHRSSDPGRLKIKLAPPTEVAGVVLDEKGNPLADALVEADIQWRHEINYYYFQLAQSNELAVKTDAAGQFRLEKIPEGARLHLRVSHPNYAIYYTQEGYRGNEHPIRAGSEDLQIALEVGTVIEGRLVLNGQPFEKENIIVHASAATPSWQGNYALTDGEGKFSIISLKAGDYDVYVKLRTLNESELVCVPQLAVSTEAGAPGTRIDLELTSGQVVRGSIVDEVSGKPLNEQSVSAWLKNVSSFILGSALSDAEGRFALRLPPGEYELTTNGWRDGRLVTERKFIHVESDIAPPEIVFAVSTQPQVSGRLVDKQGNPVQGTAMLDAGGSPVATDENGKFCLPVRSSDTNIGFAFDPERKQGRGFLYKKGKTREPLELVLEPVCTVIGRIVDDKGNPIADTSVELSIGPLERGGFQTWARPPWTVEGLPGGRFKIHPVPIGLPLRLSAKKLGYSAWPEMPKLKPGETLDMKDVALRALTKEPLGELNATISGIVIDENEKPVIGTRVSASIAGIRVEDSTDQKGRFRLAKLPANRKVRLHTFVPDYGHCSLKDVETGSENVVFQVFPQGYEWYGKPAPVLQVAEWINCEPQYLSKLEGKVVLLHIGAHIEGYSRYVDKIQRALEKYGDRGLVVIGIHVSPEQSWPRSVTADEVAEYLEEKKIAFPFAVDRYVKGGAHQGQTYETYGAKATPSIFLVDKKGNLRRSVHHQSDLDGWIKKLLAE